MARTVRVLVAEDNPFIADLVQQGLRGALRGRLEGAVEFEFESAPDGAQALARCRMGGFDLLVCDVMMPVLDGPRLIQALRAGPSTRDMKILAMSAAGPEAEQRALAAGADFFLEKPLQLSVLVESLVALLGL